MAIETSCDETSAAVIKDGPSTPSMELGTSSLGTRQEILSNVISSQIEFHRKYGGIVPELASRKHIEVISPVIKEAIDTAKITFKDIDAVAVTYGPGLVGSLIVGLCAAKALAWSITKPLIGVNHLEGHLYANFLTSNIKPPTSIPASLPKSQLLAFPFISLLVSGGHTMIILVEDHGKYKTLGRTRDDAAGEAFDKIARFLKIGYPGGPIIDKLAKEGNPHAIEFKRPMIEKEFGYDFSFSGLKTAVVNYVQRNALGGSDRRNETRNASRDTIPPSLPIDAKHLPDLAASFQQAIVDVLVNKTIRAAKEYGCKTVTLAGGVSANSQLRQELKEKGDAEGLNIIVPPLILCTDNAAMIACAAFYQLTTNNLQLTTKGLAIEPVANLRL